jgi:hypothetical protein
LDTPIAATRRSALLPGQNVLDAWNDAWRVDDSRRTDHDFEIYIGRPAAIDGPHGRTTIITAELADHFERHRRTPQNLDLPLSKTTVTRIRMVLGHHRYQDAEMWWLERVADLERLTIADFAVRHGVSAGAISQARAALAGGPRQRPANWWRSPDMQALLHSKKPTAWIAMQMGLSAVTIRKYRSEGQQ